MSVRPRADGVMAVAVRGEIDLATVSAVEERMRDLRRPGSHLALDLDHVSFMDSAGLRLIVDEHRAAIEGGWRFSLIGGSRNVRNLIDIAGLTPHVRFIDAK